MRKRSRNDVTGILDSLFSGIEGGSKVRENLAIGYWPEVVGPQAAAATEPDAVRDGILFVKTKSSVWSQELTLLKAHIIKELNKRIGRAVIKEIVFRAQGVKKAEEEEQATQLPDAQTLEAVTLSPKEQAALDRDLAALTSITDPGIRAAVHQRMIRDRKLQHWQREHGWTPCTKCGALHHSDGDLCPICRICG